MLHNMPTVIKATPENAHQLREIVAGWAELAQMIDSLRRDNLFPGLRCMTVTLDDAETKCQQMDVLNPVKATGG